MGTGINISDNDLFNTLMLIRKKGGSVFYDRVPAGTVNATAAGTGTSRTSISTSYSVPSGAAELLAVAPGLSTTADAAADVKMAMFDIQGASFKRSPEQFPGPVGSVVLSAGAARFTPQEWWQVRAPVFPNDQYDWGVTPLVGNTHNMKAWYDVMYSTIATGLPTIYGQHTGITAFKAAGQTSTGSVTLTAATELYEVASMLSPEAAAVAQENQIVSTQVTCSALNPIQTFTYGQDVPAQIAATSGDTQVPQISRYLTPGERFKIPTPQLVYASNLDVATSNNLTIDHFARFI